MASPSQIAPTKQSTIYTVTQKEWVLRATVTQQLSESVK